MKTYDLRETKNPDLFRVVDLNGDWKHYYHAPSKTYLRSVNAILTDGYTKGAYMQEWLSQHTAEERDQILSAAGDRGDMVHRTIETILTNKDLNTFTRDIEIHNRLTGESRMLTNDEWSCILSWAEFWNRHAPQVVSIESAVYNLKVGYAGTNDAVLVLTKCCEVKTCPCKDLIGKVGLFDWKTSKGIYPSYSAQNAAYAMADNAPKEIAFSAIVRLGTRHKTTGGYEMQVSNDIASDFARFIAAKSIADFEYTPFDPAKEIVDIPEVVKVVVLPYVADKLTKATKEKKPRKTKKVEIQQTLIPS